MKKAANCDHSPENASLFAPNLNCTEISTGPNSKGSEQEGKEKGIAERGKRGQLLLLLREQREGDRGDIGTPTTGQ